MMATSAGAIAVGSSVAVGQGPGLGHMNTSGQGVGQAITSGQGITHINTFPDEKRIRELAEQIRGRLSHAHQLKLAASQQQQTTPAATMQISQAEEIKKRLQDAITHLQGSVRDFSLAWIQERLGGIAQRLNLKLDLQCSQQLPGTTIFLIHEGFYVEVCCHDNSTVTSVKLSQANTTQEDSLLAGLLLNHDFVGFETHLKSLVQFYSQATNDCDPSKMYRALSAMEAVLITINERSPHAATEKVIMENPLGHVTPRRGGLPMQLTFFVHPYEVKNALTSSEMGVSVGVAGKVTMEKSSQLFMLSTDPNLFDVSTANFFPVSVHNSSTLPLTFVFELTEAIPVCSQVRDELLTICGTEQSMLPVGSIHINQLIAKRKAEKEGRELIVDKCRLVCLPDQYHYYLMPTELRSVDALPDQISSPKFCGAMVPKVPFLHPGKIFNIIMLLRKQLVYNALIGSCLGRSKREIPPPSTAEVTEFIFELTSIPPNQVMVTMDMQSQETMIVNFVVPDQNPTAVEVGVKTSLDNSPVVQTMLSEVAQRCLSIPVTLRAAMKHPTQLLGNKPTLLLQKYHRSVRDFESALHSSNITNQDVGVAGGAAMAVGALLGRERDLTSIM